MHKAVRADDRINRTGWQTQRATDAFCFIDNSKHCLRLRNFNLFERSVWTHEIAESDNQLWPSGRTKINRGTCGHRFCVGHATRMSALCALGLWQQCINFFGQTELVMGQPPA
tara:strand:- start:250 stop:588 length:339 start_codon:yes stop_codon:yes gene_type:complete